MFYKYPALSVCTTMPVSVGKYIALILAYMPFVVDPNVLLWQSHFKDPSMT